MKIAIVGTGISGLGAAYLLNPYHDIDIYERNHYVGGHARTIDVTVNGRTLPVDTGFIVFNDWNYPHLMGLFKALNVPFEKSDMSFGVSIDQGWLEYSSNALFAQKKNMLRPAFLLMLKNIVRFNRQSLAYIEDRPDITLGQCMDALKMGPWFRRYYLLAMGAAIWSCPVETMMDFPATTFLRFFKNHGLLNLKNRPQWYTVTGGSREYIKRITAGFFDKIHLKSGIKTLYFEGETPVIVTEHGEKKTYDHVIFTCHADQALALIDDPTLNEVSVLGAFDYQDNDIVVHSDASFMPQNRGCWASWVYLLDGRYDTKPRVSLTYWMNNLQNLDPERPVFVTLNADQEPDPDFVHDRHRFRHPVFDVKAIEAQAQIGNIQGKRGLWFCGAYQRYGFHEDGLLSAVRVAEKLGAKIPWPH